MKGLARAVLARCPICGERDIWRSFGDPVDHCPTCGYRYEREEGYWVGAMIVNLATAMMLFLVVFVGGMLVTWPDVPWNAFLVAGLVLVGLGPVAFYRQSKTVWVWLDLHVHPYEGDERDWERRSSRSS